jgi:metal-responsive CopG/Arc/MetJ family transcriptional regulator
MATGQTENLSLPDGLQTEIEKVARAQARTVNEVLAEAVDRYIREKQWQSLKSYGRQKARERGIKASDVPRLIAESRREHEHGR